MKTIYGIRWAKKANEDDDYNFDSVNWNCHARFFLKHESAEQWLRNFASKMANDVRESLVNCEIPFSVPIDYFNVYLTEHPSECCGSQFEYEIVKTGERFIFWVAETQLADI